MIQRKESCARSRQIAPEPADAGDPAEQGIGASAKARQLAKPCVVGCNDLTIDAAARRAVLAGSTIAEGDWISVDGDNGGIYLGRREVFVERPDVELAEVERWHANTARCKSDRSLATAFAVASDPSL